MRKLSFMLLTIIFMMGLSGCEMANTPEELISQPEHSEELKAIYTVVNDYLPRGAELAMPITLNGTAAINFKDIDGCGKDEVIAIYKKPMPEPKLGVIILKKDIAWILWKLIDLEDEVDKNGNMAYDIHLVDFIDITGDGVEDLLIGCFFKTNINNQLYTYSFDGQKEFKLINKIIGYDELTVEDITDSGNNSIVAFNTSKGKSKSKISIYEYKNGAISLFSEMLQDDEVSRYKVLATGNAMKGVPAVFVQKNTSNSFSFLEILAMKNDKLVSIYNGMLNYNLELRDNDNDSIIEIKRQEDVRSKLANRLYVPKLTTWNILQENDLLKTISKYYTNDEYGYTLNIPLEWGSDFTIISENDLNTNMITVAKIDEELNVIHRMFSIKIMPIADYVQEENMGQTLGVGNIVLYTDSKVNYIGILYNDLTLTKDTEDLNKIFTKLN